MRSTNPLDSELPPSRPASEVELDETVPRSECSFDRIPVQLEKRGATSHVPPKQTVLFDREIIWKESVIAKLDGIERGDLAEGLRDCHTIRSVRSCVGCKKSSIFWNRCERFYCPVCASRLARERAESVEWWSEEIAQPKHVVLTSRNSDRITRETVLRFKKAFSRLRRRAFTQNWKGGFYRLEVTNEGRGWHLHLHALVDCGWIDARELAREWADCIGQTMAIVKVKDVRQRSYLQEVTKYVVKGNELSSWNAADIAAFIDAFSGLRTFGVFGSLFGKRTEWREWLDQIQANRVRCECGCDQFRILEDWEFEWGTMEELKRWCQPVAPPAPPPHPDTQLRLLD